MPMTAADLDILHRYLHEIDEFIESIIGETGESMILVCKVFLDHKEKNDLEPFPDEGKRKMWLYLRARNLARDFLNKPKTTS